MSLIRVEASGSHRDVGRAYGEAAAVQVADAIRFYDGIMPGGASALAGQLGPFVDAARARLPRLVEELEGLAEGSGRSFDEIAVLNCMEEVFDFEACTSVVSGRFLLHAEQWYAGHTGISVIVGGPDGAPPFVSPTCTGFLAAVGMNACGIAQGIDSVYASDDRVGVPRLLVSRNVLGATSLSRARKAATIEGRAGGYAHVLATVDERFTVETSATRSTIVDDTCVHTNHFLGDDMDDLADQPSPGSIARYLRAMELAERPLNTVNACIELLSDHVGEAQTICNHGDAPTDSTTVFGMVCDLANGTVFVSDGPPCEGAWETFKVPSFETREVHRVG